MSGLWGRKNSNKLDKKPSMSAKRRQRNTFILEEIITPSVGFPVDSGNGDFCVAHPDLPIVSDLPPLFTLEELGISLGNNPSPETQNYLTELLKDYFEQLQKFLGLPINSDSLNINQLLESIDKQDWSSVYTGLITPPTTEFPNIGGGIDTLPPPVILPIDPPGSNGNNSVDPNFNNQLSQYNFSVQNQPLIGVIDTGFSAVNPDIDYSRVVLGSDRIDNDNNPLLQVGEGNEHGSHILGIIGATQNNGIGINGINDDAKIWVGRGIGSGHWADSLKEFVDAAKASGQPNGVVNLSLDLTQTNPDGTVTTRYEFTPKEREAIEYARQNHVLIVAAAGNDGSVMSVLGQASQEFDNIITVGASDGNNRADYSSYGRGLDILAVGGTTENPELSLTGDGVGTMAGTSVATAKVTGAASLVWAANPELNYRQVIEILKATAKDLSDPGWDEETGAGLLDIQAAVAKAKVTTPEVYNPTPWVTPDTWSGEGKVTPEERAAQGGTSLATATVQTAPNFSELDRVDSNQPDKYYQFTVNEPGYVKWNLTSLNPVSGFPSTPDVTIIKADGKPGSHIFSKGIGISLSSSVIGEGQTSFSGGDFYDPGTYYLKVGNGAGATFKDYNISTQFTPDQVSSFAGNIQYRTQPYYSLDDSLQSPIFSGPAVSELKNLAGVVTYDEINFNNRIAKYGIEVKESGKFRINLNSPNGKMELSVKKFIGSEDRPVQLSGLGVAANSDGWLELELNKGRYDIEVKTPSNYWQEPDWTWAKQTLVRPYTLNATFTPNAPQPGQGKVPSSAGVFDKTVVSNGVVNHYYKNGYLTVQPSGQASWYGYPMIVISSSAQRINEPVPLTDPDGNYSIQTAANLFGAVGGADLGNGVNTDQVEIGRVVSSIGGKDLSDFYKFSLNGSKLVSFKLSDLDNGANFELIQDLNGNGQIDRGEVIATRMTNHSELWLDRILGAGNYYLRVSPGSSGATTQYVVNAEARFPENQVIAGYNSDYYLVQNAQLRWIPNQETLNALKINPNTVKRFSNEDLARIPSGNLLPSQKDGDVFADFAGNIYLMQSEKRSLLPKGYTPKDIGINVTGWPTFPESDLTNIPLGQPINRPAQLILNTTVTPINETPPPSSFTLNPSNGDLNFTRGQQWVTSDGYKFVFQQDGNLVMYNPQGKATWATGTYNTNATRFAVQHDGNVVLYDDKKALWATNTSGYLGAYFKIQGDGNLVVYDSNNQSIFDTKTYDGKTGTFTASADWLNQQAPQQNLNNTVGYDGANTHPTYVNTFYRNGGSSALGSATGNVYRSVDNGYLQEFSGGSEGSGAIMKSGANDNSYWVGGSFWNAYVKTGGVTGVLGYPTSDRYEFNGGWKQNFQNGTALSTTLPLTPVSNSGTNTSPQAPQIINRNGDSGTGKLIQGMNFRNYPWIDSSSLVQGMPIGTTFTILEKVTTTADPTLRHSDWYRVRLNDGREGYFWAGEEFIQKVASGGSAGPISVLESGVTPIKEDPIVYLESGVTPIDNSNSKSSLELGLNSLSWTKQRLEELDRLIDYRNQFELPISSDQDDLLFKKFANRPGTGKEFNYAEYLQLKAVNSLLNGAIDYTTQTDDLIEDYIDSIADSEDFDTAQKLFSLKQSWESGRKQAQETINQKSKTPWGSIILDSFAELGRIFENSAKGAFYGISAYLRIQALVNGGPLAKLSSYYSTEDGWQRLENTRISEDTGKLVDVLGWILSDKWGDLQKAIDINKSENFTNLGIVVSAIAGDIMGWIEQYRLNGGAGLIGDFKSISDEINKIVDIDKILAGQSGIYVDEDDREFLNGLKVFSIGRLMSTAFSMVLNASKLGFGKAAGKNDILATIESSIKIFNDVSVIIEQGYEAMSRGNVRNSYDRHVWLNELYNSTIRIDREYIIGVAEVLGDYVARQ